MSDIIKTQRRLARKAIDLWRSQSIAMMESEVTGNCHASFGERDGETRKLKNLKVRSVPTLLSPLLANIALHGMENRIKQAFPKRKIGYKENGSQINSTVPDFVRYADDFVILHEDITVVQRCREIISEWLNDMGLELKPSKTRLAHTLNLWEQEKSGFEFLDFNIRQFSVGKYQSGKSPKGGKLGFKTIITPSSNKLKVHYDKLASTIDSHRGVSQVGLIKHLNPIIRGWANYYATVVSKAAYSTLDYLMYKKLRVWANRRHPQKAGKWISDKYWQSIGGDNWVFATRAEGKDPMRLLKHSATKINRYVKVKGESSPYDGNLVYWSSRMGDNPEMPKRMATLLKKQKGKCTHCKLFFRENDVMEVDHKIPKSQGGKETYDNWQLLHRHCHDTKTANDSSFGTQSGCNSTEPKPTKRIERIEEHWVTRSA